MQPEELYAARKADWEQLTTLLGLSQRGVSRLSPDQVRQMGSLYRQTTADLALAQRDFPRHHVTLYLNQLVARGHAVIYQAEPLALRRLWAFIARDYPRLYRRSWPYVLTAMLLLFVPAILGGLLTYFAPQTGQLVLPSGMQGLIEELEAGRLWTDIAVEERPYTSTFIMTNNIQVSFAAFAGGVLAGLFTVWTLVFNGLMLGGVTGLAFHYGIGWDLWAFVIGHGVVELSVICIAGAAGLMLGWAILHPGLLRRRDALMQTAGDAVRLLSMCVPLLIVAGTIEGFISPAESLPWAVKWAVGLGSGALMYAYLLLAGRKEIEDDQGEALRRLSA